MSLILDGEDRQSDTLLERKSDPLSPSKQASSVTERKVVDEGEDLSEDEVFSQVFRSRDPKELMFLALLEREFLKLLEKPLEERLKINLKFPPMNGWFRLLIHKTAARFRMKSVSDGDGIERSATVFCLEKSKGPGLLFADMYPTGSMKFGNYLRVPDPNFKQSVDGEGGEEEDEEEVDSFFSDPRTAKKKKKRKNIPKAKAGHQLYIPAHRRAQALADATGVTRNTTDPANTENTVDKKPSEPPKPVPKKKDTRQYYIPAHRRAKLLAEAESEDTSGTQTPEETTKANPDASQVETDSKTTEDNAKSEVEEGSRPAKEALETKSNEPEHTAYTIEPSETIAIQSLAPPRSFSEGTIPKSSEPSEESNLLFDYNAFLSHSFPKSSEMSSGQSESAGVGQNVLEIYAFHPSTMTEDLESLLGLFGTQFRIKWVDDTHALAIFSTAALAERALRTLNSDPEFKLRPLSEASEVTKRCCDLTPADLTPPAPRPATCTKVATRMILNALNVRSPTKGRGKK